MPAGALPTWTRIRQGSYLSQFAPGDSRPSRQAREAIRTFGTGERPISVIAVGNVAVHETGNQELAMNPADRGSCLTDLVAEVCIGEGRMPVKERLREAMGQVMSCRRKNKPCGTPG